MREQVRHFITVTTSLSLLLTLCSIQTQAQRQQMTLTIGRPNVWSLAQAHYLLANMRSTNRSLKVASPGDLDPSSVNGVRMEVLRTLLGIEGQVSTPQALTNSVAQQQFQADFARKQSAIARLDELSKEHLQVIREISDIDISLAALGPQPPEDRRDPDVEKKRVDLTAQRSAKVNLRDAIAGQITTTAAQANASAALTNLGSSMPLGTPSPPSLPSEGIGDIKDLINKMLTNGVPAVDASQKLDNYIDMQYEVISKQLTLLRDETGPDERLVFLELPSSLFTVPKSDDDQMVNIDWHVSEYYSRCDQENSNVPRESRFIDHASIKSVADGITKAKKFLEPFTTEELDSEINGQSAPVTVDYLARFNSLLRSHPDLSHVDEALYFQVYDLLQNKAKNDDKDSEGLTTQEQSQETSTSQRNIKKFEAGLPADMLKKVKEFQNLPSRDEIIALTNMLSDHPELLYMGWTRVDRQTPRSESETRVRRCYLDNEVSKQKVRVIDTVPRQSALSVNDVHATQKGLALTAKFLTLFGFGAQVSYQRQRSIYEQFINQDVFGSGYGKGTDSFGWTFGPIPGTNRLAPGPRTTFAILAIPKNTWQINIQATAKAFPRSKSPTDTKDQGTWKSLADTSFDLLMPTESTEGFWINSIDYSPVSKGERVTAIVKGDYFSPLTGVMVDGIPLKRAVAIAKHEGDSTTLPVAADSPGEYEYLSQNELIISFKTSDSTFVGTPLITLVTPEKTSVINFFRDLHINHRYQGSLQYYSSIEPMFIDDLTLDRLEIASPNPQNIRPNLPIRIRVYGKGFRRRAEVCLNEECKNDPRLTNSGLYVLTFNKPASRVWTLTYRFGQRVVSTRFDTQIDGVRSQAPAIDSVENPATNKSEGLTSGGYHVIIRGSNLENVTTVVFGSNVGSIKQKHSNVLLVEVPQGTEGGVEVFLEGQLGGGQVISNILDFMTPGKAIFKYVKPAKQNDESQTSPQKPVKKPKA